MFRRPVVLSNEFALALPDDPAAKHLAIVLSRDALRAVFRRDLFTSPEESAEAVLLVAAEPRAVSEGPYVNDVRTVRGDRGGGL